MSEYHLNVNGVNLKIQAEYDNDSGEYYATKITTNDDIRYLLDEDQVIEISQELTKEIQIDNAWDRRVQGD